MYRSGEMILMTARSEVDDNEISSGYWITSASISGFMILYTLIHVIIYIDGAWQSCRQYRNELVKYMNASGTLVLAVKGRISCNAVFDFMYVSMCIVYIYLIGVYKCVYIVYNNRFNNFFTSIFRDYLFADITYDRRRYDRIDTSCE